jgi:hypothetical protein
MVLQNNRCCRCGYLASQQPTCLLQTTLIRPLQLLLVLLAPSALLQLHHLRCHCLPQLQQLLPALLPSYCLTLRHHKTLNAATLPLLVRIRPRQMHTLTRCCCCCCCGV